MRELLCKKTFFVIVKMPVLFQGAGLGLEKYVAFRVGWGLSQTHVFFTYPHLPSPESLFFGEHHISPLRGTGSTLARHQQKKKICERPDCTDSRTS